MSIRLMSLAWDIPMSPTKKLVLLAMCDWANDFGYCFPSMATVARRTCISKRQCQRIMSDLVARELIAVTANRQGGAGSKRYQINVAALRNGVAVGTGDKLTPANGASPEPATTARNPGDTGVTRTVTTRQSDPPPPQQIVETIDWRHLPQFTASERVVVVDLIKGICASQHQEVVDELAGALRAKAIRGQWPGWLRGLVKRAQGGGFTPNHALGIQHDRRRRTQDAMEAEKRRLEEERRNDPVARARGLEAMAAAVAALANSEE